MDKYRYEQSFSECKKCCSLIKTVFGRNITVLSINKLYTVWSEYGKIVKLLKYQLVQIKYLMFVMNMTLKQFLEKCGKYLSSLPTDNDENLIVYRRLKTII